MNIRIPYRAGSFYPASSDRCRREIEKLIESAELPANLPQKLYGGLVPHAGWAYSGQVAALTFKAICSHSPIDTFVLLGADHTGAVHKGEVFDSGIWRTPLGDVTIDEELACKILRQGSTMQSNVQAHAFEHSIEVQIPFIQVLCENAKIVPIAVPPTELSVEIGQAIGRAIAEASGAVVVVGSTDLTHHGGHFPAPGGQGKDGELWSRRNDRRMLDLVEAMNVEKIIPESNERMNACGAGAIAATLATCKQLGATVGQCLKYTNSYQITHAIHPDNPDDTTVGYASVIFA